MIDRLPEAIGQILRPGWWADLLYPRRCGGCGRFGDFFCLVCRARLAVVRPSRTEPAPGFVIHSAYAFDTELRQAIHALKYGSQYRLAEPLGELLAEFAAARRLAVDAIVPIPLHPNRERWRGFNQAERLARPVSRRLAQPIVPGLRRVGRQRPQARMPNAEARRQNVTGAFQAGPVVVAGRRVLLIDDVTTTGATLTEAASTLLVAGAQSVTGLTLARAI